jgi:hypothetical protein
VDHAEGAPERLHLGRVAELAASGQITAPIEVVPFGSRR